MPKGNNQKLKLYRLAQVMMHETDAEHGLTMPEIIEELSQYEVSADRKSLYEDLALLEDFGIIVEKEKVGKQTFYKVVDKPFETAELKLLVDAIQSSKFITVNKSKALIKKLMNFVSRHEEVSLDRGVYVSGRIKTMNESIYYNVDAIYNAISDNRQISFEYLMWNIKKELVPRKETRYVVSPWGLAWEDENYYLVAYDEGSQQIRHYRVDKMRRISATNEPRDGRELFERFDVGRYTNKNFGMFAGEEESVRLEFDNKLVGVLLDRFGKDITIYKVDEDHSETIVKVAVSSQFYGWVFGLGSQVVLKSPQDVVEGYKRQIDKLKEIYDEE